VPAPTAAKAGPATFLVVGFLLKLEAVAPDTSGVVVEGNVALVAGKHTVWDDVAAEPTLDTTAGGVNGGVLEAARTVAGPVVDGLRWQLGDRRGRCGRGCRRRPGPSGGVSGRLERVRRREVEV
jgi:hypothetical protein